MLIDTKPIIYMNDALVSSMTKIELIELIRSEFTNLIPQEKKYYYGLDGLAEILGCCKSQAFNLKKSGRLNGAYTQCGRKIVWDRDKVLELAGKKEGGRR